MTVALLTAWLVGRDFGRIRKRSRPVPARAVPDCAALLGLALDSGMGLSAAIGWTAEFVDQSLRLGLTSALRNSSQSGLAAALREAEGPSRALLQPLARPVATGAAVGPVLAGLRSRLEAEYLADFEERLERLPVKLLLPLALLMLPGLLMMIVAPAVIDALSRLG